LVDNPILFQLTVCCITCDLGVDDQSCGHVGIAHSEGLKALSFHDRRAAAVVIVDDIEEVALAEQPANDAIDV
jgi:hypothetical protein